MKYLFVAPLVMFLGVSAASAGGMCIHCSDDDVISKAHQKQGQAQGQHQSVNNRDINKNQDDVSNSIVIEGDDYPVSSAYAPALAASAMACMGSSSGGVSLADIGISGGSTWVDQDCVDRAWGLYAAGLGLTDVAISLLCVANDGRYADLMGDRCDHIEVEVAASFEEDNCSTIVNRNLRERAGC